MRNTSTTVPVPDNIRAAAVLEHIKGCKVADDYNNQYEIVDVKCFNGKVQSIGLKNADGAVMYASKNVFLEMASVA